MMETINLEFFAEYLKSVSEFDEAQAAYLEASRAANAFLKGVEARQQEERNRLAAMLADLDSEEKRLRKEVRRQMTERAESIMNGGKAPEADKEAAARLAVIPEEENALRTLSERHRMTKEEIETWKTLLNDLCDAQIVLLKARHSRATKTAALQSYAKSIEFWGTSVVRCGDLSDYTQKAYRLNADGEETTGDEE